MNAVLRKLLASHQMEYLTVDRDLLIVEKSWGVHRFADRPFEVMVGKDVRLGFPELIGAEDCIIDILQGRQTNLELKGIARSLEPGATLYIDLHIIIVENRLVLLVEEVTEKMVWQQTLMQRTHEANLLLSAFSESQRYLDKIITSIADALLVTTVTGKIKTVNKAALDLFGYSEGELINKEISALVADENFLTQTRQQNPRSQTQFLKDCAIVCHTKTGKEVSVAFSCSAIETDIENLHHFVYIGRDITERQQTLQRQDAEYATTAILSESATLEEATPKILQAICSSLRWELGELWCVNQQANELRHVETWHVPSVNFSEFESVTRQIAFLPGVGLPGRVWVSGAPAWIDDVVCDANFLRTEAAIAGGLHGAFGFPISSKSEILGVMAFYSRKIQEPQSDLLKTMAAIGCQIGQFIKRKQAEAASIESEERFQAFINNSPAVAFMKEESGRYIYVNKQLERVFNVKETALQGKTDFDWLPEETAKQVRENDLHALSTGKTVEVIETVPTPDGCLHYWLVFKFPFRNGEGQQLIGGVAVDITDRKLLEQALFEEKELAQVTLQSIGDAVITTDAIGRVKSLNPIAEQLTGWSQQDARGKPLTEVFKIVSEITREPADNPIETALREGRAVGLADRTVLIDRNGGEVAIDDSAAPIRARDGQIIGAVMVFHDVTQTRNLADRLTWQASHDALTGLVNRREFENRLEHALSSTKSQNKQHALCYLDLDRFKMVNDTCGHLAGDELLRQVTALFQTRVRSSDTLARLGGDEFGILLENCPLDPAVRIANVLRECIQEFRFVWQNKAFAIGVSIGLVVIDADCQNVVGVLSAADAACYIAKNKGRNRVHVYQADDRELAQAKGEMQWVGKITQALEENRFRLYYQSIVPLAQTESLGEYYEVLLRLVDETGNLVSPMAFIPAAERYNLMQALDRWVIRTLFATQGQHYRERWNYCQMQGGNCDYFYAINLSGASINDDQFLDFLREQLALHQIPPQAICFEITETAAIANLGKAAQLIRSLKDLGCRFALDDFGSGMSSFAYLKNLPVDFLKIDGTFIKQIVDNPIDLAMVEAINQIGHVMGIKTIAEFVENDAILEKIKALGVDYAQGYGIAKPCPFE